MKRGAITLPLGMALIGVAMFGMPRAESAQQPAMPSTYSASALYDLGNFYARMGRPAMAVLNYERARVFAPNDPDIRANLDHVRESMGAPMRTGSWLNQHVRWTNPNILYWIGLFGLALTGISLLLRRPTSAHRTLMTSAATAGIVLTALAVGDAAATATLLNEAVVMFATPASASPVAGADPVFTASLADIVRVRDQHAGFDLISDSQGREGWVASRDLQPVIPPSEVSPRIRQIIH